MFQRKTFGLAETRAAVESALNEVSSNPSRRIVDEKETD